MIPLVDLALQYKNIKNEIIEKIEEVLDSRSFILGEYVSEFENKFAKLHQVPYCSGCSNGTTALFLALTALGIKAGDEVITSTHTFVATAEAIAHTGARPVLTDIDPDSYNLDINKIEGLITEKTRAIIPVHIYGQPVDMDLICAFAGKHSLKIVEDCAQAHLGEWNGRKVGTFGDAAAFSFFPGKNLGAYGDAGAVITTSKETENRIRKLLDHGRTSKYLHEMIGYNERMDGIQAGILVVKMRYLEEWTKLRKKNALIYNKHLGENPAIKIPAEQENSSHVYHLYVIQVSNRQEVIEYLKKKGITASIHYPVPVHLQPAFSCLGYHKGDFPEAEKAAERILSLPMYPELNEEQIEFICDEINKVAK
jgi:dTDP-4-amino-4,6-dideoxygalactose transaminase